MLRHIAIDLLAVWCLPTMRALAEEDAFVTHKTLGLELAIDLAEVVLEIIVDRLEF